MRAAVGDEQLPWDASIVESIKEEFQVAHALYTTSDGGQYQQPQYGSRPLRWHPKKKAGSKAGLIRIEPT
jgi:hypothetical protein